MTLWRTTSCIDSSPTEGQRVLVRDCNDARCERSCRVVRECGAEPVRCEGLRHMQQLARTWACRTALLGGSALGPTDPDEIETIRAFKAQGFTVVCYQDELGRWPIGVQCRIFLAGCSHLLDSSATNFEAALSDVLRQRLQEWGAAAAEERELRSSMLEHGIVGGSASMLGVFRLVRRMAALSDLAVLITGESGTGKELIANAIHRLDARRRDGPFVPVNCAAIARDLAESELFGHRSGAFTGAARERKGLFRAADGGVLFLDEIAELDDRLQSKLLRVLQEQRVLGVGEETEVPVNVRVVAATNADLTQRVAARQFRADLFNRLNALSLQVPPLRERGDDVKLLAQHILHADALLRGQVSCRAGAEFLDALTRLPLPGNVRELENLMRWVLVHKSDDQPLSLGNFPREVWAQLSLEAETSAELRAEPAATASNTGPSITRTHLYEVLEVNRWNMSRAIKDCEGLILQAALEREGGNQSRAAKLLGITSRSVYNKLRRHRPNT